PWIVDFNPSKAFPSVVLTWIRFPGLPGFLYKRKVLEQIGSLVGKVARLDLKPDNRTSGRFTRMVVFVDLDKPLISQVLVNGKFQIIEFEALPAVCFAYGRYGHVKGSCHFEMVELNLPSKEEKTIPLTENVNGGGGSLRPLDDYRTEGANDGSFGLAFGKSVGQSLIVSGLSPSHLHGPLPSNSLHRALELTKRVGTFKPNNNSKVVAAVVPTTSRMLD
ncbi:hypothetical protein Gotri_007452, partial [Gossypium trilobum]|nr:hypothetical protein [Gossypium trilobum]